MQTLLCSRFLYHQDLALVNADHLLRCLPCYDLPSRDIVVIWHSSLFFLLAISHMCERVFFQFVLPLPIKKKRFIQILCASCEVWEIQRRQVCPLFAHVSSPKKLESHTRTKKEARRGPGIFLCCSIIIIDMFAHVCGLSNALRLHHLSLLHEIQQPLNLPHY